MTHMTHTDLKMTEKGSLSLAPMKLAEIGQAGSVQYAQNHIKKLPSISSSTGSYERNS